MTTYATDEVYLTLLPLVGAMMTGTPDGTHARM